MITWLDVIAVASNLDTVPTEQQSAILDAVDLQVEESSFGRLADRARALLAAHFATLWIRPGAAGVAGPVVSETVGSVSRTFANLSSMMSALSTTVWGREYEELLRLLPVRVGLVL